MKMCLISFRSHSSLSAISKSKSSIQKVIPSPPKKLPPLQSPMKSRNGMPVYSPLQTDKALNLVAMPNSDGNVRPATFKDVAGVIFDKNKT